MLSKEKKRCLHLTVHVIFNSPSSVRPSEILLMAVRVCLRPLSEHYQENTGGRSMLLSQDSHEPDQFLLVCLNQKVCLLISLIWVSIISASVDPGAAEGIWYSIDSFFDHQAIYSNFITWEHLIHSKQSLCQNGVLWDDIFCYPSKSSCFGFCFLRFFYYPGVKILRKNNGIYKYFCSLSMVLNYSSCICPYNNPVR